jgi:aldehyde:ferredoxin oxidoreductase
MPYGGIASFGYAGKTLKVDLSSGDITETPTTDYTDRFLGGRGLAAKVYWDEVSPEVRAFDPQSRLIFATGPLGGLPTIGGSRWTICGKSAATERFSYCNLGGGWGANLKFAGYDAVVVHGQSERPVYLLIDGDQVELKSASAIWGKGTIQTREALKREIGGSVRVVAIGPAGENRAIMASFLADNDASGSGQLAASMGAKQLKAIVVRGAGKKVQVGRPDEFKRLVNQYRELKVAFPTYSWTQMCRWSRDLVLGFRAVPDEQMKREPCYGCIARCPRQSYHAADGTKGKFLCHSAYFYQPFAERYYGDWNDVPFHATKLCDSYGVDTMAIDKIIGWLDGEYKDGAITEENTDLPLSKIGSLEFIENLLEKIALRKGIGDILAKGLEHASGTLLPGVRDWTKYVGLLSEPGYDPYGPRLYLTCAFFYAMEPRFPIQQLHEVGAILGRWRTTTVGLADCPSETLRAIARTFWGGEVAADFSTYEGKALAAIMIQDRQYAKECLLLCDFLWPQMFLEFAKERVGDPAFESKVLSAVTDQHIDELGLRKIGERVFNLQRAILAREGHRGREFDRIEERCFTEPLKYEISNPDCIVPGPQGQIVSRMGATVDRAAFEKMKDEYYSLRHWDVASGLQTRDKLEELGLGDVAQDLEQRGLLAGVG